MASNKMTDGSGRGYERYVGAEPVGQSPELERVGLIKTDDECIVRHSVNFL